MLCPICYQLAMAAARYELRELVKHIATRHPREAVAMGVVGSVALLALGPKVWRMALQALAKV